MSRDGTNILEGMIIRSPITVIEVYLWSQKFFLSKGILHKAVCVPTYGVEVRPGVGSGGVAGGRAGISDCLNLGSISSRIAK